MDLAHLFRQTFTYAARSAVSDFGEPLFDAKIVAPCREQRKSLIVVGPTGAEEQSDAQIFTPAQLEVGDWAWLPGADTSKRAAAKRVLAVEEHRTLDGVRSHFAIYF